MPDSRPAWLGWCGLSEREPGGQEQKRCRREMGSARFICLMITKRDFVLTTTPS